MLSSRYIVQTSIALLLAIGAHAQAPDTGTPPRAPEELTRKSASREIAAPAPLAPSTWIDTSSRAVVQASYFNIFLPTKSVAMGWLGDLAVGNAGDTAQSYKDAVLARINWVRALAGVPPVSALNPTYNQDDQQAAMMMSVNGQLNHFPPTSWKFYSANGAIATQNSNLCFGFSGLDPGCIKQYMYDSGSNNTEVGHRRWILYPQTASMGTGDIPLQPGHPSANALWVIDSASYNNPRPATRDGFVSWPSKGYFPYELLPVRWTFSYPGADFTTATVTMTRNGSSVPVAVQPVQQGFGENTIAWVPDNQDPAASVPPSPPSSDTTTTVMIQHVLINGAAQDFTYNVTIFDPNAYPLGTTFNFSPPSASFGSNGGAGTVALTVSPANTFWGAVSNADWLAITSGFTGIGNGTINYVVSQTTSGRSRSGQISAGQATFSVTQAGLNCTYSVSPGSFSFGPQAVSGTVTYTASPFDCAVRAMWDVSWINGSFSSAGLDFTVQANAGATRTGHINISGQVVTITQTGTQISKPPFGFIDTPINGSMGQAGAINFTGWALSPATVSKVALCREPVTGESTNVIDPHCLLSSSATGLVYMANAVLVPGVRPDVASTFPGYPNNNWGWGAQILTNQLPGTNGLPPGNGTYKLHAIAADPSGLATDLGTTTISANNAASILPFGTIDTPAQGETVSGNAYVNFGWVVTPQPNIVPVDGSTITVHIDGVPVGHPTYNNLRSDIATLFPGLRNSNGAVGFFFIDTTKLSNGIHSIDWVAADSAGHNGGLGSRNFFVRN